MSRFGVYVCMEDYVWFLLVSGGYVFPCTEDEVEVFMLFNPGVDEVELPERLREPPVIYGEDS